MHSPEGSAKAESQGQKGMVKRQAGIVRASSQEIALQTDCGSAKEAVHSQQPDLHGE